MTIGLDGLSKSETVVVAAIERGAPSLVQAREINATFQAMVRRKSLFDLDRWLERARTSLVSPFAKGVIKDKVAVSAAISSNWSNGQNEGQITKLKLVTRQLYGRGKFDLSKPASLAQHEGLVIKIASESIFHAGSHRSIHAPEIEQGPPCPACA